MSEQEYEQTELPLAGAGPRLRAAREAAGLTRAEIASRTRIAERMIAQMEAGDFAALPARTYAVGFARTYAKAVGLDQAEIAAEVRRELGMADAAEAHGTPALEPGDPARIPSARFAWILGLIALVALVAGLWFWRNYASPAIDLPSILPEDQPTIEPTFTPDALVPGPVATLDPMASATPDPALTSAAPVLRRTTNRPSAARIPTTPPPSPQADAGLQLQPTPPQSSPTSTVTN